MLIEITYNVTDVFVSTTQTPIYVSVSFEQPSSGGGTWGSITGTLSNQTDLQTALDGKFDDPTGTTLQYIDGTGALQTFPLTLPVLQQVRNQTGFTLDVGTVVYINGATGNLPTVTKAIATGDATSAQTLGMVSAAIANNGTGYVVVIGTCSGLDTSAYTEGQQLYLSGTTAGAVTTTKPYAPIHLVYIGIVTRAHPTLGTIEVRVMNGFELEELHDVDALNPNNNDGLFYNSTTSLWEHKQISTALGYTPANAATTLTINGVTYDLSANRSWTVAGGISGSGAAGQVAYWTGANSQGGSATLTYTPTTSLLVNNNITASGAIARCVNLTPTLVAAANNDVLVGLDIAPTFTNGAFTNVINAAIRWSNNSGWGLYGAGTADNYLAGRLSIGTTGQSQGLRIGRNPTTADSRSIFVNPVIQNTVTSAYVAFSSSIGLNTSGFTLPNLAHFEAIQDGAFTAGVVTNHYGFRVNAFTSGTNIYAFHSNIASATGRWNIYMAGTAANYMNGSLLLGSTTDSGERLQVTGTMKVTGQTTITSHVLQNGSGLFRIENSGSSAPTGSAGIGIELFTSGSISYIESYNRTSSAYEQLNIRGSILNFRGTATFISSVTSTAFIPSSATVPTNGLYLGATNTLTFSTNSAEKMRIDASGSIGIGSASINASAITQIDSTTKGFLPPRMTTTQKNAISSPAAGLVVYDTTLGKLCVYTTAWETITSI